MSKHSVDLRTATFVTMIVVAAVFGGQCFGGDNASATPILIEPGVCVGKVRAGMTIEQVVAELGKPDSRSETSLTYPKLGLEVVFKNGVVRLMICGDDGPAGPPAEAFKGRTKEGIGIGSSRDEVIKAFGEPGTAEKMAGREELLYKAKAIHFSLGREDGKVVCIQVGFPPTNSPASRRPAQNTSGFPGYATPEATFESFTRAVSHHDVKAILACFTLEDQKVMEPEWQQQAAREGDAFLARMARDLEGLRINGKRLVSDNEIELTMSRSNEPSRLVWFKRNGADWKLLTKSEATTSR